MSTCVSGGMAGKGRGVCKLLYIMTKTESAIVINYKLENPCRHRYQVTNRKNDDSHHLACWILDISILLELHSLFPF